jgi:glycosyltransferase involved in cell wall biosynthesis
VRVITSADAVPAVGAHSSHHPSVLMITGAYYPELSGGGLQARGVVRALQGAATFAVLTTSTDPSLPARAEEDGVPIRRVYVDVRSPLSRIRAACHFVAALLNSVPDVDVVNLHGFSRKAILLVALTRLFGKRFVLTLQTGVHDEPSAVRALGALAYWAYGHADRYLSVSPGLSRAYLDAGLPESRLRQVCNAVDTERFRPSTRGERAALRVELGLPPDLPLVLFVGFFSRDKRPDLVYHAWAQADSAGTPSGLLFIGASRSTYQEEVDESLAPAILARTGSDGVAGRVFFVESTYHIEKYFRAADVYVLPSIREGLPIALLEAMSSGLSCIAARLPGSTDALIDDGVNGLLVTADDRDGFAAAIRSVLDDARLASRLGAAARQVVLDRYSIQRTAAAWLAVYNEVSQAR